MQISIHIDGDSTANELIAVGNFARELAISRGAHVSTGPATIPADEAELQEPEVTTVPETLLQKAEPNYSATGGTDTPKRRRRTKAEIEADIAEREAAKTDGPFYWSHPESNSFGEVSDRAGLYALLAGDPCCEEVTAEQYATLKTAAENSRVAEAEAQAQVSNEAGLAEANAKQPKDEFETVAPATGKNYTEAEVQQIATVVARTHGADKVKGKIAELGAQRIAGLEQGKLNELGSYLEALK